MVTLPCLGVLVYDGAEPQNSFQEAQAQAVLAGGCAAGHICVPLASVSFLFHLFLEELCRSYKIT